MKFKGIFIFGIVLLFVMASCKSAETGKAQDKTQEMREKASKSNENAVALGKTVTFDYAGGYINGTLFDTSIEEIELEIVNAFKKFPEILWSTKNPTALYGKLRSDIPPNSLLRSI